MKNIYNSNYENYYQNNSAYIYMFKSSRKNAKTADPVWIYYPVPEVKVDNEGIMDQIVKVVNALLYQSLLFNKHIEITSCVIVGKQTQYINADNNMYNTVEYIKHTNARHRLYSFEQLINEVYKIVSLVYPYNTISSKELFENKSIKYLINVYYERG